MKKSTREEVFKKFDGNCAYTGKKLEDKWEVDHIKPRYLYLLGVVKGSCDDIENLLPTHGIINHYKRGLDLEQFRKYMLDFHKRLSKLPKKTNVPRTQKRKEYMFKVAELFGITPENPFPGTFYFETLN